jgi:hypothetical protein
MTLAPASAKGASRSDALRIAVPALIFLALVGWLSFAVVPLTYDEAYNWTNYAAGGIRASCCHYNEPNNHVFYTILSSQLNSASVIGRWPFLMRLPNLLVVAAFVALLAFTVFREYRWSVALAAVLLWSTPHTLRYSLLGRGYLLGTLLLVAGTYLLIRRPWTAWLPLALSVYTVPTFVLHFPGIFLVALFRRTPGAVVAAGLLTVLTSVLLYWPILDEMRAIGGGTLYFTPQWPTLGKSLAATLHVPEPFGIALSAIVIALVGVRGIVSRAWSGGHDHAFGMALFAGFLSYVVLNLFVPNLFVRNGVALGLLLVTSAVLLARQSGRWVATAVAAAFAANFAAGLYAFSLKASQPGGFVDDTSFMGLSPHPLTARHWNRFARTITTVDCRGYVDVSCAAFDEVFKRHAIKRETIENASGRCLIGTRPFPGDSGSDLFIRTKYGETGRLCFP